MIKWLVYGCSTTKLDVMDVIFGCNVCTYPVYIRAVKQ